jgi:serine/threonine-protein kinase
VYRAEHAERGVCAFKVLRARLKGDPNAVTRFLREAGYGARVEHPSVVRTYEYGEAEGQHYLALELVPGLSVAERIAAEGPLPLDDTVRIAAEVGAGLDALHRAGIVHRDVEALERPARRRRAARSPTSAWPRAATLGAHAARADARTMDYLAPELIRGEEPSAASDVYAFGCLVYRASRTPAVRRTRPLFGVGAATSTRNRRRPCARCAPTSRPASARPSATPCASAGRPSGDGHGLCSTNCSGRGRGSG